MSREIRLYRDGTVEIDNGIIEEGSKRALQQAFGLVGYETNPLTGGVGNALNARVLKPQTLYAFSGQLSAMVNGSAQATYTQAYMIPCQYSAIRIGWPHRGGAGALTGLKMLIAATDNIGDLSQADTAAAKKFVVPQRAGVAQNSVSANGWQAVTWGGNAEGAAADAGSLLLDMAWSDMIPLTAVPLENDPGGRFAGYYPLLVRVRPGLSAWTGFLLAGFEDPAKYLADTGPDVVLSTRKNNVDAIATPSGLAESDPLQVGDASIPIPQPVIVAYGPRTSSVMFVGDSRFATFGLDVPGFAYKTTQWHFEQAALASNNPTRVLRCAHGGQTTATCLQRALEILDGPVQPNVAVYLVYSVNDEGGGPGSVTQALLSAAKARTMQFVERCMEKGIVPLLVSIFPKAAGFADLAACRELEAWVASLNLPYFSPWERYGNPDGTWKPGVNMDSVHMSDTYNRDMAHVLYGLARPYL